MSAQMYDVIVIGAGVAGSSAAYHLASAGLKVLVLEKEKLPRYKTCGGGVINRAAELLPFSIEPVVERVLSRADIFDHSNNLHYKVERSNPVIFMVMRADFDNFLLSKALEDGAVVHDESDVIDLESTSDCVEVKTKRENFKAKFVIAADGATGVSARCMSIKNNSYKAAALEVEVNTSQNIFDQYKNTARFDYGFVPHGYAWVFPKKKHLSIGVALMKKTNQSLHKWLEKYFGVLSIGEKDILKKEKHGYVIPLASKLSNYSMERVLFAGDALGLADPITAEGISFAIESGQLAAQAIIGSSFNPENARQEYKEKLTPVFKELNSANFLSFFVYGSERLRKFVFKYYGKRLSELMTDIIMNEKTYYELVRNPLNYFKLLRPGFFFKRRV